MKSDSLPPHPQRPTEDQKLLTRVRNLLDCDIRAANTYEHRATLVDKALRIVASLNKRLDPVERGRRGGEKTAERGPEYFRKIAAMRKTRAGGRPRKPTDL